MPTIRGPEPDGEGAGPVLKHLSSPHVLVMDQHLELLEVLGYLFHEEGYSVSLSSRLLSVDEIEAMDPQVIVLDAMFDGGDGGCEVIRQLRSDARVRAIPVICCTTARDLAESVRASGLPTLLKPYDLDDLLTTVSAHLAGTRG